MKLQPQLLTSPHRRPVLFRIEEKFALPNDALWAGKPTQHFEHSYNLLYGKRRARLLAISKRRICNPYLIRHFLRYQPTVSYTHLMTNSTVQEIEPLVKRLEPLMEQNNVRLILSISADIKDVPDYIKEKAHIILFHEGL